MLQYQILKRNKFLIKRKFILTKKKLCSEKLNDINFCSNTEIDNLLTLNKEIKEMNKELNILKIEREKEFKKMIKVSTKLTLKEKVLVLKNQNFNISNNPLIAKLTHNELIEIIKASSKIEECHNNLTKTRLVGIEEKLQKVSGLERTSVELSKVAKLLSKNPTITITTTLFGVLVVGHQYAQTTKALMDLSKKMLKEKEYCLINYKSNLELANNLGFSPDFKPDDAF